MEEGWRSKNFEKVENKSTFIRLFIHPSIYLYIQTYIYEQVEIGIVNQKSDPKRIGFAVRIERTLSETKSKMNWIMERKESGQKESDIGTEGT